MTKVISFYGGPGTGKSTSAAAVFAALKMAGVNCEYIQEYAKDRAWEFGDKHTGVPKVFKAQEYLFGKQHFRMRRCAEDVDVIVTDSPLLLGLVYMPEDFPLPSLRTVIREAYCMYENLDVFLVREKAYNPLGRFQTEDEAKGLDTEIRDMLIANDVKFETVPGGVNVVRDVFELIRNRGWYAL